MTTQSPQYDGFTQAQQEKADRFFLCLNDPGQVLVHQSPEIMGALLEGDRKVAWANASAHNEKFSGLKREFLAKIFCRGLYAAADGNPSSSLVSRKDDVFIGTLIMAGRLLTTISVGAAGSPDYRKISFKCADNDPATLHVSSYVGKFSDLETLVATAAKRFADPKAGPQVMQRDRVGFAGIQLGEKAPPHSKRGGASTAIKSPEPG